MSKRTLSNAIPPDLQIWIDVRRRHHLPHAHVQMARYRSTQAGWGSNTT
jgi:hypothetical protein